MSLARAVPGICPERGVQPARRPSFAFGEGKFGTLKLPLLAVVVPAISLRMRSPKEGVCELPDEVPTRNPASFSVMPALIVRQRPRGACRERRKRGQSGREEDERFKIVGQGPRTKSCDAPSAQPAPKSLQNGISTSFRHVFA